MTDQATGNPITEYQVSWTFFDTDATNSSASGGQEIRPEIKGAIIPPDKYLVLSITASGYKKWFYRDPSDPSRPAFLRLAPGEEKELPVELEPQSPEAR